MTVSRETEEKLAEYVTLLTEENERQNLISKSSVDAVWSRHIEDSLQLLDHAPLDRHWLDIGSGAGLPGIVLAIAGVKKITLVEPRRLRTEFLEACREKLELRNVTVVTGKAENLSGRFDVITARAVAALSKLFAIASPLISPTGQWVLPKGRSAAKELEEARVTWQGDFRLEPSRTDPDARILVARGVRRRAGRG
ncbi:16S rRNA (guanine(527)-N(7))-methyltransferase RsmG [Sphingomonas humi]|uniref:16S rRNA (guanine(527)-N(7))-methyltransferase RsmG n=1 Tax=Sphingomonas humi TaxID=335630 RepID=UPI0031E3379C